MFKHKPTGGKKHFLQTFPEKTKDTSSAVAPVLSRPGAVLYNFLKAEDISPTSSCAHAIDTKINTFLPWLRC